MDQTLQRLLNAEQRAEAIVHEADQERDRIIQGALQERMPKRSDSRHGFRSCTMPSSRKRNSGPNRPTVN